MNTIRNYQLLQELGRGTYGVTYLGIDTRTNRQVAVKTIDINKSQSLGADVASIRDEIDTLAQLASGTCSRYIACYYESFEDNLNGAPTMFIISEYIEGGSLTKFMQQYPGNLYPSILWPLYLQLLLGLKFIHERGYAHRDIKPDNILITNDLTIKYIDFGISCLQQCRVMSCTNTCRGSPGTLLYMPPENFTKTKENSLRGAQAHDIWSLAMVLFELAHGPFNYPYQIFSDYDRTTVLPDDQIMAHIAQAPEYSPNYQFDDGRTNAFLSYLIVNNWQQRPNIEMAMSIFSEDVAGRVWNCA